MEKPDPVHIPQESDRFFFYQTHLICMSRFHNDNPMFIGLIIKALVDNPLERIDETLNPQFGFRIDRSKEVLKTLGEEFQFWFISCTSADRKIA